MITKDDFNDFLAKLLAELKKIEEKIDRLIPHIKKDILDGDELLDNQDVCLLLKITKRTLQRYKQFGKLPYYKVDGISYYKKSDVLACLKKKK